MSSTNTTSCFIVTSMLAATLTSNSGEIESHNKIKDSIIEKNIDNSSNISSRIANEKWFSQSTLLNNEKKENIETLDSYVLVEKCLNNIKFDWRTINGMSKELCISFEKIEEILKNMGKKGLIVIGINHKNKEKIYTFYDTYEKNTKWYIKYLDAIKGRIIR